MQTLYRCTTLVAVLLLGACARPGTSAAAEPPIRLAVAGSGNEEVTPEYGLHEPFNALLEQHVKGGRVDYAGFDGNADFAAYLDVLRTTDRGELTDPAARMAFDINGYNALVIKSIVAYKKDGRYRGVGELAATEGASLRRFFKVDRHTLAGETLTLDQLETRLRETYRDPRIHAAVNCASASCPPLLPHAWPVNGPALNRMLDQAMRDFVNDATRNHIDPRGKTLALSMIFKWYAEDFGTDETALRDYLAGWLSGEQAALIRNPAVKLTYLPYDWSLNEARR